MDRIHDQGEGDQDKGSLLPSQLPEITFSDPVTDGDREDLRLHMNVGIYAAPIILIHLVVIYLFVSAQTGWRLPAWLPATRLSQWIWVNGGLVAACVWGWRRGGLPFNAQVWLRGWPAVGLGALWLVFSLMWIILPAFSARP